jgi:hypothetical protein
MANTLPYRNRAYIDQTDPKMREALDDIVAHIGNVMDGTNTGPANSQILPPPNINKLTVTASQGIFDAKIEDNNSPTVRNLGYFLEYSENNAFSNPTVVHLGPSRNWRGNLGNKQLFWRAYSQYPTSQRSTPVYHNGGGPTPMPVLGGGGAIGPAIQTSSGSGTSAGASGSDGGYGQQPFRGSTRPVTYKSIPPI